MATNLRTTDVVIVGLGAVGGGAGLPLAQAGLEVIGLEAGTWLTPRDFAPDELRNNFRGWPQSAQKANSEIPTHRPPPPCPPSIRVGRGLAAPWFTSGPRVGVSIHGTSRW